MAVLLAIVVREADAEAGAQVGEPRSTGERVKSIDVHHSDIAIASETDLDARLKPDLGCEVAGVDVEAHVPLIGIYGRAASQTPVPEPQAVLRSGLRGCHENQ